MKKTVMTIRKNNYKNQLISQTMRLSARLIILLTVAVCGSLAVRAQTCMSPDIVTVRGTTGPNNYYPGSPTTSLLDLVGFNVTADGYVEFVSSYPKRNPDLVIGSGVTGYYGSGSFLIKSYNAGGSLIDTMDLPSTQILIRIGDNYQVGSLTLDGYTVTVFDQVSGHALHPQIVLQNRVNLNVIPGEPAVFLNNLNLWEEKSFNISFPVGDHFEAGLDSPLTSLSATITAGQPIDCPGVPGITNLVNSLPQNSFRSTGHRNALLSRLNAIEQEIQDGNTADAIQELRNLRRRVDGCGATAETDDWIVDCAEQTHFRLLIDQLITSLGG